MSADIEQYYREYGKKLYLYLMTLCNEPETAEELTQETFYQAIRQLPKFRGDSSVFTWLCGIARNLWKAELRRRKYHPSAAENPAEPDPAPPPDASAESRAISVVVLQQLHALPEQDKELILLRAAAGLSFRTIGEIFGKSENWARVSYYRARQKLKGDDDL
ncbi:MAG: sigma-70 family RNA polymerase sigma factor [Oscillospiraceae bacterium]|nr:sigma-70 family RNA polymerase sigma factor [Oscillospiraceae bacterium]